jgi:hypothetical protein
MPVITAFEFDDGIAAGKAASQADRAHRGFGTRTYEAHQFDRRHELDDAARQRGFQLGGGAEGQAIRRNLLHRRDHLRMGVTENHGAPGAYIVDEAASVGGRDPGARRLLEKNRLAADAAKGTDRRIDPARNVLTSILIQTQLNSPTVRVTSSPPLG